MLGFKPKFNITDRMMSAITQIERARGFLEAATLSDQWVGEMAGRALLLEAHYTTHIEGTQLTLDQARRVWDGESVPEANRDDVKELLNYRDAFEYVSHAVEIGTPITERMIPTIAAENTSCNCLSSRW